MKTFFAYALLVAGVPTFVGNLSGFITAWLFSAFITSTEGRTKHFPVVSVFNGLAASITGALLVRLFGLTPGLSVPIIMTVWVTFYFFSYHQSKRELVSWIAGIFIGWFTLVRILL